MILMSLASLSAHAQTTGLVASLQLRRRQWNDCFRCLRPRQYRHHFGRSMGHRQVRQRALVRWRQRSRQHSQFLDPAAHDGDDAGSVGLSDRARRWRTIVLKEAANALNYSLYASGDTNVPSGLIRIGSTDRDALGTSALPLNTWTHLAATYSSGNLRLSREWGAGRYAGRDRVHRDLHQSAQHRRKCDLGESISPVASMK